MTHQEHKKLIDKINTDHVCGMCLGRMETFNLCKCPRCSTCGRPWFAEIHSGEILPETEHCNYHLYLAEK